jgi:hypothetical protein
MMSPGKALRQERVMNRNGEGNVDDPAWMDVTDLCRSPPKFHSAKTMRMNRNPRP